MGTPSPHRLQNPPYPLGSICLVISWGFSLQYLSMNTTAKLHRRGPQWVLTAWLTADFSAVGFCYLGSILSIGVPVSRSGFVNRSVSWNQSLLSASSEELNASIKRHGELFELKAFSGSDWRNGRHNPSSYLGDDFIVGFVAWKHCFPRHFSDSDGFI